MNSNVPESAVDDLNAHTSSDDGVSDKDIQRVADFIELALLRGKGDIEYRRLARRYFIEMVVDHMCDHDVNLCDEAISDYTEAGFKLLLIVRCWIKVIAEKHFDEFADEARNLGWIE